VLVCDSAVNRLDALGKARLPVRTSQEGDYKHPATLRNREGEGGERFQVLIFIDKY
jgi:hypothetical protein